MARAWKSKRTHKAALQVCVIASAMLGAACGDDGEKPDGDSQGDGGTDSGNAMGDGDGDTGDGDSMTGDGDTGDGDTGDGDGSDAGPTPGCSTGGPACEGATPVCVNDKCVECSAESAAACGADEVCDTAKNECAECSATDLSKCAAGEVCSAFGTCVEKYGSFQLDCANLPAKTGEGCEGGPKEVILAQHERGLIAMLDPIDGHFLGWFKRDSRKGEHYLATQGPDQCIWTVVDDDTYYEDLPNNDAVRAIERWNTDGTFKDEIINQNSKRLLVDEAYQNVVDAPYSIGFTKEHVYVASTSGYKEARISRWKLSDDFSKANYVDVVLDDGSVANFLYVTNDGSMIIANDDSGNIEFYGPNGVKRAQPILDATNPMQIAYAGNGKLWVSDQVSGSSLKLVDIESGQTTSVVPVDGPGALNAWGVATLEDGNVLIVSGGDWNGLAVMNPSSLPDPGKVVDDEVMVPFEDGAIPDIWNFNYLGRACLPTAFVDGRAPGLDTPIPANECAAPDGATIFAVDFEDNTLDGLTDYEEGITSGRYADLTIENESGNLVLKIDGGSDLGETDSWNDPSERSGVFKEFAAPGIKPSYIEYSFKFSNTTGNAGTVVLGEIYNSNYQDVLSAWNGRFGSWEGYYPVELDENVWHKVQVRINWDLYLYDLYLDCERVANDISFSPYNFNPITKMEFANHYTANAVSWFDNIIIK